MGAAAGGLAGAAHPLYSLCCKLHDNLHRHRRRLASGGGGGAGRRGGGGGSRADALAALVAGMVVLLDKQGQARAMLHAAEDSLDWRCTLTDSTVSRAGPAGAGGDELVRLLWPCMA